MAKIKTQLGGYQEAAQILSRISGRNWSRQGVQRMHQRREANGFPDRKTYEINGKPKELFQISDVLDWYAFSEAAGWATDESGKLWVPSDIWKLWRDREETEFPDRAIREEFRRKAFDEDDVRNWVRDHTESDS